MFLASVQTSGVARCEKCGWDSQGKDSEALAEQLMHEAAEAQKRSQELNKTLASQTRLCSNPDCKLRTLPMANLTGGKLEDMRLKGVRVARKRITAALRVKNNTGDQRIDQRV